MKFIEVKRNLGAGQTGPITIAVDAIAAVSIDRYNANTCHINLKTGDIVSALESYESVIGQIKSAS